MKKIYLAIPYTWNREKSFQIANQIAAELIEGGNIVYSPISMSHPIQEYLGKSNTWETWQNQDLAFIEWCDVMYVIIIREEGSSLNGMQLVKNSVGVQAEVEYCKQLSKPIKLIFTK